MKGKIIEQFAVTPCSVQPWGPGSFLEVKGEASPVMANTSWFSPKGPRVQTVKATSRAGYLHLNPNPSLETYVECVLGTMSADGERVMEERWRQGSASDGAGIALVMMLGLLWCHPHVHISLTSDTELFGCVREEIVHLLCYES